MCVCVSELHHTQIACTPSVRHHSLWTPRHSLWQWQLLGSCEASGFGRPNSVPPSPGVMVTDGGKSSPNGQTMAKVF